MEIVVSKRSHDWHACLKDRPEIWGCGKSIDEAIGSLIRAHAERFGISLTISPIVPY